MKSAMDELLEFNRVFVENKEYEEYRTTKLPDKKLAIVSCMDTRLTNLLPAALNLKNGDVKMITNAGALISHPFGSTMRSLMISVYFMGVREISVIGHYDCGMHGFSPAVLKQKMKERGISREKLDLVEALGIDLGRWFKGFDDSRDSILSSVAMIRNHPLLPADIQVRGFLVDPRIGRLEEVFADMESYCKKRGCHQDDNSIEPREERR